MLLLKYITVLIYKSVNIRNYQYTNISKLILILILILALLRILSEIKPSIKTDANTSSGTITDIDTGTNTNTNTNMSTNTSLYLLVLICILTVKTYTNTDTNAHPNIKITTTKLLTHVPRVWCMRPQYMACQKYTLHIYCKGLTLQIIVVCGVFRYNNISAESPAKSTLSQGHGLSTGGVSIYLYLCISYVFTHARIHTYIDFVSGTPGLDSRLPKTRGPAQAFPLGVAAWKGRCEFLRLRHFYPELEPR